MNAELEEEGTIYKHRNLSLSLSLAYILQTETFFTRSFMNSCSFRDIRLEVLTLKFEIHRDKKYGVIKKNCVLKICLHKARLKAYVYTLRYLLLFFAPC